ncbi:MAG: hypothetical protein VR65_24670 [Desulfobulbaceae bacterium BRH_c16a]|nr:MAG: hypothetical protein VR65_24670 [Desulfobulbaceae bacterium BRH_c16a]
MKASSLHAFFVSAGLIFLIATSTPAGQSLSPVQFEQRMVVVEDLAAEFHTSSGTVIVTAKIKNVSQSMIRGYATIYLLSAEGKKIHAYQEEVNGGEVFAHGTTVDLKATSKISDINKLASISVDFTKS